MNNFYHYFKNLPRRMQIEAAIALGLTIIATVSVPVLAWFSNQRKLGDLERVDTPTRLYITAAHDDIKYLQLTDIKVSDNSADAEKKKYYVFCVSGKSASYYSLQLAYTTNNQFEYFVYPAHQLTDAELKEDGSYLVKHTAHDEDGEETDTYYYKIEKDTTINQPNSAFSGDASYRLWTGSVIREDSAAITTRFINKNDDNDLIADNSKHNATYSYKRYDDNNANADIEDAPAKGVGAQLYSEPVYWQALRIKSGMDASNQFENYYILEVNWEKAAAAAGDDGLKDDKETDIIYIAAEATS